MNKTIEKVVSNMNMEGFTITKKQQEEITNIAINDVKKKKLNFKDFSNMVKLMTLWEQFGKNKEDNQKKK